MAMVATEWQAQRPVDRRLARAAAWTDQPGSGRHWARLLRLAPPLLATFLALGCSRPAPPPAAPQMVIAGFARPDNGGESVQYSGEVQARFASALSFRVDGKIVSRSAHLGDRVQRGQPLATLDPDDLSTRVSAARAALAAAENRLVLARQQQERNRAQIEDDLVSRAEVEQSDANLSVAQADLAQRRADLDLAQDQLRYGELDADHDGFISSENAEVGSVVKAGQQVFGLAWSGERDAVIDVPEGRIGAVSRGLAASVTLLAGSGPGSNETLVARVRDIAAVADPQSRTYRVRLALAEPTRAPLGASVRVALAGATRGGAAPTRLSIPATALFHDGNQPAVWVIGADDRKLTLRAVQIADYGPETVTLAGGLTAAERIVLQGVHAVNAGQVVTPVEPRGEGARP